MLRRRIAEAPFTEQRATASARRDAVKRRGGIVMDAKRIAEATVLRQTEERLQRVGLVVDRAALSAPNRRALMTLQRLTADEAERPAPARPPLGFAYPPAR